MTDDVDDWREEIKDEIRRLKDDIREEVLKALRHDEEAGIRFGRRRGIHVEIGRDELERAEPSAVIIGDIVKMVRDSVKASLAQRGEKAVDELVEAMPETSASELLKSLANPERMKIVKMLYSGSKTFSEMKTITGLEPPSVSHHLKSLLRMGLVGHGDLGGYELTRRGRFLIRTLALIHEAMGGETVDQ